MNHADYHYYFEDGILKIVDEDRGRKSVTNDAEWVLTQIHIKEGASVRSAKVHYKDSDGRWDEIVPTWQDNRCINVQFKPI